MRTVGNERLSDLAILAAALEVINGDGTEDLFCWIDEMPVLSIETSETIGHFIYDESSMKMRFRPTEDKQ